VQPRQHIGHGEAVATNTVQERTMNELTMDQEVKGREMMDEDAMDQTVMDQQTMERQSMERQSMERQTTDRQSRSPTNHRTTSDHGTTGTVARPAGRVAARGAALRRQRPQSIVYAVGECPDPQGAFTPLGIALVARSERGVCAILLGEQKALLEAELARYFPAAKLQEQPALLSVVLADWWTFLRRPSQGFPHPLDLEGTPLQQQVWDVLRDIPAGTTLTYTDVAARVGRPDAVRAIASACAANRLAVVIPCHRVVGRSGSLTGYRWGIDRKRQLLEMESRG
jgi:AraC family transcriptional regulator of adaptative response/methylated-DNA-[protein]-cysteine methyltransferase